MNGDIHTTISLPALLCFVPRVCAIHLAMDSLLRGASEGAGALQTAQTQLAAATSLENNQI